MVHRPYGRRPIARDQARGFAIGVIIAAIAIIGVVATASYTIFGNQLVSMNRVSREDLNLNLVRTAARVVASLAEDVDSDTVIELPAWLTGAGPTGGGVLPADFPGNRADAWGSLLGYCTWDNGATNASVNRLTGAVTDPDVAMIMAIISSGPNKTFETTCADAAANVTNGDDLLMRATTIEAATGLSGGESVWTKHSETMISYGETQPGVVRVGIGTAAPSQAFVVHTPTANDGMRVENATSPIIDLIGAGAGNDGGQITLYNAGIARARVDANGASYLMGGALGIGTNSPTNLLEINQSQASGTGALISNTDAGAAARSYLSLTSNAGTTTLDTASVAAGNVARLQTSAPSFTIGTSAAGSTLSLQTAGTTRITFDDAGRLALGAAISPTAKLTLVTDSTIGTAAVFHNNRTSGSGHATYAITNAPDGWGVYGDGPNAAVGTFSGGGVLGASANGTGVRGISTSHIAVQGTSNSSWGGHFVSYTGPALYAETHTTTSSVIAWGAGCGYSQLNNINYGFHTQCNMYAAGSYQGSDARLKERIAPLQDATRILMKLRPVEFDWRENSDQYRSGHRHDMGLIAQEVKEIIPALVRKVPAPKPPASPPPPPGAPALSIPKPSLNQELGSFYAVEYTRLIPYLIKALQEQAERNDALEARLAAVEKALAAKP